MTPERITDVPFEYVAFKWTCDRCGVWIHTNDRQLARRIAADHKRNCEGPL